MLENLMQERRYVELNGLKVEPRFAEKPLYTVRDLWSQVTDKKFLDTLKEKRSHMNHKRQREQTGISSLVLGFRKTHFSPCLSAEYI